MELKENATFLGFVRVSDLDGMFVGMGAEGFAYFSCFLKRYALFSLEPMPNISCSVKLGKIFGHANIVFRVLIFTKGLAWAKTH